MTHMNRGTLQTIELKKGFGFIRAEAGGADVFFHKSACGGKFAQLSVGDLVEYELDEVSDRPRAQHVKCIGKRGMAASPQKPRHVERRECSRGFVTKIHVRDPEDLHGFISADQGGPEIRFEPSALSVAKWFDELRIGDYVEFTCVEPTEESQLPRANYVRRIARQVALPRTQLARHPKSRRKKPSWR